MQLELLPGCEYPQAIGALFAEYTDMLVREDPAFASYLELQHYDQEVAHLEQKYGPPGGMLYLARADGQDAGCIGLRRMDASRCEMKRLYVRPAFRGCGIAHTLVETILADARELERQTRAGAEDYADEVFGHIEQSLDTLLNNTRRCRDRLNAAR